VFAGILRDNVFQMFGKYRLRSESYCQAKDPFKIIIEHEGEMIGNDNGNFQLD